MMVNMMRLIFVISMMMMIIDLLAIMYLLGLRRVVLYLTYYETH
jgi:hypothetical protein